MRALITGISGFVGQHLAGWLISQGWEHVSGFADRKSDLPVQTYLGNIRSQASVVEAIRASRPEVVFHLAGILKTDNPEEYYATNVLGTRSVLEALVETGDRPRVVITGSSAVYGPGVGQRPISETFRLRPMTDYAVSKVAQEMVARQYAIDYGFPVIYLRTFNLLGPGQPPNLACSSFARQIALGEQQEAAGHIKTGGLHAKRDFIDVRDAVRAYELLARQGTAGTAYNVCSGQAVSIQDCLDRLLGMSSKPFTVELEPTRIQRNDVPKQTGSPRLTQQVTGWQPQIPLQNSLADLLNDWRERVKATKETTHA
jgi:GDP-4-dehydro-6-deoxy-D-mannose reductase